MMAMTSDILIRVVAGSRWEREFVSVAIEIVIVVPLW
jgi:hypothetical protein